MLDKQDANLIADMIDNVPWEIEVEPEFKSSVLALMPKLRPLISKLKYRRLQLRIENSPDLPTE